MEHAMTTEAAGSASASVIPGSDGQRLRVLRSLYARLIDFPQQDEVLATLMTLWPSLFDESDVSGHAGARAKPDTPVNRSADDAPVATGRTDVVTDGLAAAQQEIVGLQAALVSNREIGIATGILMAQHKLTDQQAFDLLRVASQHSNRKLRDVASDVVFAGTLPDSGPGRASRRAIDSAPEATA
jgi:hypothetical protein